MKLLRWVSFQGDYGDMVPPDSDGGLEGSGIPEVAQFLASGLQRAGVSTGKPEDRGGWAYDLDGEFESLPFEIIVASTDEVRPWVVSIELRHRALAWRRPGLAVPLARLCEKVDQVIRAEPRAKEIRWYTNEAWDEDPDNAWTPRP